MTPRTTHLTATILCLVLAAAGCQGQTANGRQDAAATPSAAAPEVSGRLEGGLRILTIDAAAPAPALRVYRGDYVQFALAGGGPFTVAIDSLKQSWSWPVPEGGKPYLKMTEAGRYAFTVAGIVGAIEVIEYKAAAYREVNAAEAAQFVANLKPFVLDVRTGGEFAEGHLAGAVLLPVQELQKRLAELAPHRQEPVFVYCHSGNRSTVAAKLLIDAGFENVVNLRRGISEWKSAGLPLVK